MSRTPNHVGGGNTHHLHLIKKCIHHVEDSNDGVSPQKGKTKLLGGVTFWRVKTRPNSRTKFPSVAFEERKTHVSIQLEWDILLWYPLVLPELRLTSPKSSRPDIHPPHTDDQPTQHGDQQQPTLSPTLARIILSTNPVSPRNASWIMQRINNYPKIHGKPPLGFASHLEGLISWSQVTKLHVSVQRSW